MYRLIEPEQYRDQHVLVVGGGDSAIEAGLAIAEIPGARVTLSYRGEAFSRIKTKNRIRLSEAMKNNALKVMLSSQVKHLSDGEVVLSGETKDHVMKNDAAIVCAGGELPTKLLQSIGVTVESHMGKVESRR